MEREHALTVLHQVQSACLVALLVDETELDALVEQISFEDSAGALFNPTQYQRVGEKFQNLADTVSAFRNFYDELRRIKRAEDERVAKVRG